MIEIIQEEMSGSEEKMELPKNIRQMGAPDIGDRIYIENKAYQYMHPYDTDREKTVYVLLGKFEAPEGKQCVFVEAAICLDEIHFEGDIPEWNDDSWSYLYKKLKHVYDNMVIVGWALDIRGKIPDLTVAVEQLHRTYFGGTHQILCLMDTIEKEDAFYSMKNGCLKKREGFYIYYQKECKEEEHEQEDALAAEPETIKIDVTCEKEPPKTSYRTYLEEKAKKRITVPAYLVSGVLFAAVCLLGYSMLTNYRKMSEMEAALKQMDHINVMATEQTGNIKVEKIDGDILPTESKADVVSETTETQQTTEQINDPGQAETGNDQNPVSTETADVPETQNAEQTLSPAKQYLQQGYYIVQKGDSLVGICREIYQTTAMLDKICEVNGIDNPDAIYEGQYLTLPN